MCHQLWLLDRRYYISFVNMYSCFIKCHSCSVNMNSCSVNIHVLTKLIKLQFSSPPGEGSVFYLAPPLLLLLTPPHTRYSPKSRGTLQPLTLLTPSSVKLHYLFFENWIVHGNQILTTNYIFMNIKQMTKHWKHKQKNKQKNNSYYTTTCSWKSNT